MITKTANAFLANAGKWVGKRLLSPTNLALNSFFVASGLQSVGEATGMTAGSEAASSAYRAASGKVLPKAMAAAGRIPGRLGRVAKGAVTAGHAVAGFAAPVFGGLAGSEVMKKAPIYARKNPLPDHVQV